MIRNEFYYASADGKTNIHAVEWLPEGTVRAVIQIAHGVTEYILRYEDFAEYFTDRGFAVVGNDHLGHGTSIAEEAEPMYFGPMGSWNFVVEDFHTCKTMIEKRFSGIPYCILGFSLGSFVVRTYLIRYPGTVDAAVLIGTGQISPFRITLAGYIANREGKKVGEDRSSSTIQKLTFGTYNKRFAPNRTEYDWLCSNSRSLDAYIEDERRGGAYTAGLFRELLRGMAFTGKFSNIKNMDKQVPILLLSGSEDPVGEYGKSVKRVYHRFQKADIKDVSMKLYPGLRHDILREDCKDDIYGDIWKWWKNRRELFCIYENRV